MKRANYRAPKSHRSSLIVPPPERLCDLVRENRDRLASYDFRLLDHPVQDLRRAARRHVLAAPYGCKFAEQQAGAVAESERPLVMTGHQPELYHPGVWLKNFLAGHLAAAVGGVAVNINVDNDESHELSIRAPVTNGEPGGRRVRAIAVPYLEPTSGLPYEELGEDLLRDDVPQALRDVGVAEPLCRAAEQYWRRLAEARGRGSLVKVVTCARHQLEVEQGLANLEVLVSDMARSREFRLLVLHVLANLERFREAHNGALALFREVHHEKNEAQPVPDLGCDGPRCEMPFWVWREGQRRRRLWGEACGDRLRLFMEGDARPYAEIERAALEGEALTALAQLEALEHSGIKVRPRALTLTLFTRVFVADAFIHGLGGAIYDKVTNEIIRRYFGVEPPRLIMATGTMHLPVEGADVSEADRRRLVRRLRDVRHNPDRLMDQPTRSRDDVAALIRRKRDLIDNRRPTKRQRDLAWQELHEVNERLTAELDGEPAATWCELERVDQQLAENAVLRNREYTFALHPREPLMAFYRDATSVPCKEPR